MCARCSSPGRRIKHRDGVARPVDEQLLAGKMRLPHRRRDALPPVAVALAEPAVGVALGVLGAILLPEQSQRHARAASAPHGCATSPDRCAPQTNRIRRRKQPPLQLGIIDRVRDRPAETRHRRPTHVLADRRLADPRRLADQRRLIPSACVRRSTSRIFLIDTLSAGIGHPLVARETDQLIRLSTGARSTPPSPAVRNHRIAVRLALESVSALHRIPQNKPPVE